MHALHSEPLRFPLFAALAFLAVTTSTAAPDPKQWTLADDLNAECETDTTKPIRFRERGGLAAGTQLTADNFSPENYTTGDLVMSCKLRASDTKMVWREFERAPARWNDQDRTFEMNQEEFLVQLSHALPFMRPKVLVFRKAQSPQTAPPATSAKPVQRAKPPRKAGSG